MSSVHLWCIVFDKVNGDLYFWDTKFECCDSLQNWKNFSCTNHKSLECNAQFVYKDGHIILGHIDANY